jgi:glutamate synthase (NADPH) large chain
MVSLSILGDAAEAALVRGMIEKHAHWTQSAYARRILERWSELAPKFVCVVPNDYRRVLEAQTRMREKGLAPDEAEMAAFEQNAHDEARVGGN